MLFKKFRSKQLVILSTTNNEEFGAFELHSFHDIQHVTTYGFCYETVGGLILQTTNAFSPIFQ